MATSGVYTFSVSRDDIIREAMLNIGKLGESDVITPQETTDCARKLNMLVKQWQSKTDFAPGLKTWTRRRGHLFLSNSTGTYTVGPGAIGWTNSYVQTTSSAPAITAATTIILTSVAGMTAGDHFGIEMDSGNLYWTTILSVGILSVTLASGLPSSSGANNIVFTYKTTAQQPQVIETAILRDNQNNDIPLKILTVQEYDFLPSKANVQFSSDPNSIYYEFQLTNGIIFTDVAAAADVSKHIVLTYMETTQDFVNATDTPEYPQDWYMPLAWGLSKQICGMFNGVWSVDMEDNYRTALAIAQKREPELSALYFVGGEVL